MLLAFLDRVPGTTGIFMRVMSALDCAACECVSCLSGPLMVVVFAAAVASCCWAVPDDVGATRDKILKFLAVN